MPVIPATLSLTLGVLPTVPLSLTADMGVFPCLNSELIVVLLAPALFVTLAPPPVRGLNTFAITSPRSLRTIRLACPAVNIGPLPLPSALPFSLPWPLPGLDGGDPDPMVGERDLRADRAADAAV